MEFFVWGAQQLRFYNSRILEISIERSVVWNSRILEHILQFYNSSILEHILHLYNSRILQL